MQGQSRWKYSDSICELPKLLAESWRKVSPALCFALDPSREIQQPSFAAMMAPLMAWSNVRSVLLHALLPSKSVTTTKAEWKGWMCQTQSKRISVVRFLKQVYKPTYTVLEVSKILKSLNWNWDSKKRVSITKLPNPIEQTVRRARAPWRLCLRVFLPTASRP